MGHHPKVGTEVVTPGRRVIPAAGASGTWAVSRMADARETAP
jgi:hypothetical protein